MSTKTTSKPATKKQEIQGGLIHLPVLAPKDGVVLAPTNADDFLTQLDTPIDQPVSMPIVTISHAEEMFVMPSGETADAILGYPVLYFQTRRYYEKAYSDGSSAPPDCWSADMDVPHPSSIEKVSPHCLDCPQAQFGSGKDGKSQGCAVQTWLFLLNPAFGDPPIVALVMPPSSIKVLLGGKFKGGYLSQARAAAGAFQLAFTEFRLERASKTHCIVAPKIVGVCKEPAEKAALAKFINSYRRPMEGARGLTPNVKVAEPDEDERGAA